MTAHFSARASDGRSMASAMAAMALGKDGKGMQWDAMGFRMPKSMELGQKCAADVFGREGMASKSKSSKQKWEI